MKLAFLSTALTFCATLAVADESGLYFRVATAPTQFDRQARFVLLDHFLLGPVPEHLRVGKDWAVRGPSAGASLGVGWSAPLSAAPRISPHVTASFGVSKLNFPDGVAAYTDPATAKLRYFSLDLGAMAQVAQTRVAGRRADLTLGGGILTAFVQMRYESSLIDASADTFQSSGYIRAKLDIPLFKGASGAKGFADLSLYGNKSADIRFGIDFQM